MKKLTAFGLIIGLFGVTGIIVSQAVKFSRTQTEGSGSDFLMPISYQVEDTKTKNTVLFCGIGLLIAGGACAVVGTNKKAA